jgi:hypothetical protein
MAGNFAFGDTQNIPLWAVLAVMTVYFLIQLYYFIFRKVDLKQ